MPQRGYLMNIKIAPDDLSLILAGMWAGVGDGFPSRERMRDIVQRLGRDNPAFRRLSEERDGDGWADDLGAPIFSEGDPP